MNTYLSFITGNGWDLLALFTAKGGIVVLFILLGLAGTVAAALSVGGVESRRLKDEKAAEEYERINRGM